MCWIIYYVYVINYWKHKGDASPENYPVLFSTEQVGGLMRTMYELSWWQTELPKFLNQLHKNMGIPETSKVQISK
jgi:hypothetical protein